MTTDPDPDRLQPHDLETHDPETHGPEPHGDGLSGLDAEECAPLPGLSYTPSTGVLVDVDLYTRYLQDSDLSEVQKRAFVETLASIVLSFVDLGLGVHPLQLVSDTACDRISKHGGSAPSPPKSAVSQTHDLSDKACTDFVAAALESDLNAARRDLVTVLDDQEVRS